MAKSNKINVDGVEITVSIINDSDYLSLTDMVKEVDGDFFINDWLRNRNTLEYIAVWEQMHNTDFDHEAFIQIKQDVGLNSFKISVDEWVEKTRAIGIYAKKGKYGGIYAHKDIAFNFGMWISPAFQLYLVTEYQRLKEVSSNEYNLEWNVKRVLSKVNYQIHTDAIQNNIIPKMNLSKEKEWLVYAQEADILNVALYGCTAKQWREANPERHLNGENIRDSSSINELAVLSNLESLNSVLIKQKIDKKHRFNFLKSQAQEQLTSLNKADFIRSLKHTSDFTYPEALSKKDDAKKLN